MACTSNQWSLLTAVFTIEDAICQQMRAAGRVSVDYVDQQIEQAYDVHNSGKRVCILLRHYDRET